MADSWCPLGVPTAKNLGYVAPREIRTVNELILLLKCGESIRFYRRRTRQVRRSHRRKSGRPKAKKLDGSLPLVDGIRYKNIRTGCPAGNLIVQRLLSLKEDVEAKDWNVIDAEKEKNKLSRFDPEYLSALNSADPSVFERKHPQLF